MPWLINAAQLDKFRKNQKNLSILDASWHLPSADHSRSAVREFEACHITGSRFLDLSLFVDPQSPLPNTLLQDKALVAERLGQLRISNDQKIILYDNSDLHTSCRALWLLKYYGHNHNLLYILDGGLKAWQHYGGKVEQGEVRNPTKTYQVNCQPQYFRSLNDIKSILKNSSEQIIDARHPVRFAGGAESRTQLRAGHIPGSFSFPYFTVFEDDGTFKSTERIQKQLTSLGVSLVYPIVTLCGSGVTAAVIDFALDLIGHQDHALYDGSWSEWGNTSLYSGEQSLAERPVVTSIDE